MRLIDADELVKIIDKTFYTADKHYLNDLDYGFNNGLNETIELIENQPTAYDINSVVEELEKESYQEFCDSERIVVLKDAIKIVKVGGKNV